MNKVYYFFAVCLIFLMSSWVDCQSEFETNDIIKGKDGSYSISLKLKKGQPSDYTLELEDLNTGALIAKKSAYFNEGDRKLVFENVKPSVYTVYFTSSDCPKKKSIKGTGIVLQ